MLLPHTITHDRWADGQPSAKAIKNTEKWLIPKCCRWSCTVLNRAGNLLIWFPSESIIFCPKMSKWAIRSKKWAIRSKKMSNSLIFGERPERFAHNRSFPLSDLSKSLMVAHFWWAVWAIRSHRSFDLSEISNSLTSLTKKKKMSKNERFTHFFNDFF